jgi:putative phosphoribosyl transferase
MTPTPPLLPFADREHAGRLLAAELLRDPPAGRCVVLALPRGGVPVARPVARALRAPLDLILVRKIGAPWQPELAVAAVVEGASPDLVVDREICSATGTSAAWVAREAERQRQVNAARRALWLGERPPRPLDGTTAVLVDDGIATGTSMRAALRGARARGAARLVVAVPVAAARSLAALSGEADRIVCLDTPEPFEAVGRCYREFHQLEDEEVAGALRAASAEAAASGL